MLDIHNVQCKIAEWSSEHNGVIELIQSADTSLSALSTQTVSISYSIVRPTKTNHVIIVSCLLRGVPYKLLIDMMCVNPLRIHLCYTP